MECLEPISKISFGLRVTFARQAHVASHFLLYCRRQPETESERGNRGLRTNFIIG